MRGNVLFVEDEQALQMTVGDRLRNEGYAVDCAANGDEGFEKATRLPFDLIILDVMLPTRDGNPVNLSAREFQLLRYFIEHRGATLSREELLKQVWGYSADMYTRTVDVHVASLRQKLEDDPKQPKFILTVQGLGYKFKS